MPSAHLQQAFCVHNQRCCHISNQLLLQAGQYSREDIQQQIQNDLNSNPVSCAACLFAMPTARPCLVTSHIPLPQVVVYSWTRCPFCR